MVHYQHEGSIGRYKRSTPPRFLFNEETREMTSISDDVEVAASYHVSEGAIFSYVTVLGFKDKYYGFVATSADIFDSDGNQIFRYIDGRKAVSDHVWVNVQGTSVHKGASHWPSGAEAAVFSDVEGPFTQVVMDYLSTNRRKRIYRSVGRIIFDESQPIEPKNWEVV